MKTNEELFSEEILNLGEPVIATETQPIAELPVQQPPAEVKEPAKPKKGRSAKGCAYLLLILLICCSVTSVFGVFAWYGGYVKEYGCKAVVADSQIGKKLECEGEEKKTDNDDRDYDYVEREGETTSQEDAIIKVVENSTKAVVGIGINGGTTSEDRVIGTGFIVAANGLVVTNQHVVSDGDKDDFFVLTESGDKYMVKNVYRDEVNDIAIVKIDKTDLPVLPLGDSTKVKVGQSVIAIGNPLGTLSSTVTTGTVSGLNRDVDINSDRFNFSSQSFSGVIQTDAAINPGNSGGPLLNSSGEVIGVNFATIQGADNLSFALPIDRVKTRIDELNEHGNFRIPFVGVEYKRRVVFIEEETSIGAVISDIVKGSPAEKAGLKVGDAIIEFDGQSLEDASLIEIIQKNEVGKKVKIRLLRGKEVISIDLTIGNRSDFEGGSGE